MYISLSILVNKRIGPVKQQNLLLAQKKRMRTSTWNYRIFGSIINKNQSTPTIYVNWSVYNMFEGVSVYQLEMLSYNDTEDAKDDYAAWKLLKEITSIETTGTFPFFITNEEIVSLISFLPNGKQSKMELLYRGSMHVFEANAFHNKCDRQGPTLTIVQTTHNYVFGGYTSLQLWSSKWVTQIYTITQHFYFCYEVAMLSLPKNLGSNKKKKSSQLRSRETMECFGKKNKKNWNIV
ncbi:hypothetical protein RFI_02841 [Reticulomyxa filosa]|uniref:TLDc domain-containing protein n=1 Tax=Reticulomyxa filosa TaxID=46433 RepID=X6P812_RETFI|nr:hypothetical protein RFI_02841 [Reticulomyxa filosa]|eukprot:ETO34253.1 hypothetical protein RFI_02841 [Reticulomyxa filosa]